MSIVIGINCVLMMVGFILSFLKVSIGAFVAE